MLHDTAVSAFCRLPRLPGETDYELPDGLSGPNGVVFQRVQEVIGPRVRVNDRWLLNFTSSNYLGLNADSTVRSETAAAVRAWGSSLATPRLLGTDVLTATLERELASLVGAEAALVFPSTLHAAYDVLSLLAGETGRIVIDEHAYPISRSAARSVVGSRGTIDDFRHNDLDTLALLVRRQANRRTVVVCDGVEPESGTPVPLRALAGIARSAGVTVYVDDAHGLGLLGECPTAAVPYGYGGGGIGKYSGVPAGALAYVSSLSKAFGVPIAFVAGPDRFIRRLRQTAFSVIHSSPAALPVVAAAIATLRRHAECGDTLRQRLAANVLRFRNGAMQLGIPITTVNAFPIQTVPFPSASAAINSGMYLRSIGIWPVLALHPIVQPGGAALRFVFTALHDPSDIDTLLDALDAAWAKV